MKRRYIALVAWLAGGLAACALPHPSSSGGDTGNVNDVRETDASVSDIPSPSDTEMPDTSQPDVAMTLDAQPDRIPVSDVPPPDVPPDVPPPDVPPPIDVVDVSRDVIVSPPDSGCGAAGQLCCSGSACQSGSYCQTSGYCVTCGDNGDRCCPGGTCQDPGAHCGMVPNHAAARCIFSATSVGTSAGDRCVSACIGANVFCDGDGTTDYCILCGTRSLSCCPVGECTDGTSCDSSNNCN